MRLWLPAARAACKSRHAEALIADAPQVLLISPPRKSLTTRWPQGSSIIATAGRPLAHRRARWQQR